MIKFTISRLTIYYTIIQTSLKLLRQKEDLILKGYNTRISKDIIKINTYILEPLKVLFIKNMIVKPLYSSYQYLRGKVFFLPNTTPLKSQGIIILTSRDYSPPPTYKQINNFKRNFLDLYRGYSSIIIERKPVIIIREANNANIITKYFQ